MGRSAEARDLAGRALSLDPARPRPTSRWRSSPGGRESEPRPGRLSLAPRRCPERATTRTTLRPPALGEPRGPESLPRVEARSARDPSYLVVRGATRSLARAMAARGAPVAGDATPCVVTVTRGRRKRELPHPSRDGRPGVGRGRKGGTPGRGDGGPRVPGWKTCGDARQRHPARRGRGGPGQRRGRGFAPSRPGRAPDAYELTYSPRSGKCRRVTVRVIRRGTVMRDRTAGRASSRE